MISDSSITCAEDDVFERLTYASHLASLLCLPRDAASVVVGIEGAWGMGKTSCINLIREMIAKDRPKPIVVDYSPWLISTLDSVVEGFFVQLAAAIGVQSRAKRAQSAAKTILQFSKMLAPIKLVPGVEPWGTAVEKVLSGVGNGVNAGASLSDLDLQGRKEDLGKQLAKIDRAIVVIIDDVDRLPPEQLRIVFQMLKSVGNFRRVAYLVAYDPKPVQQALSYGSIYDGGRYLEKVVQVAYPMPRLAYVHMRAFLENSIERVLVDDGITLSTEEREIWQCLLDRSDLVRVFATPRDVVRVCNRIKFAAANTHREVCFTDLVVFETLELKFSAAASLIRLQTGRFITTEGRDNEFLSLNDRFVRARETDGHGKGESPVELVLNDLPYEDHERTKVESLLTFLFPKLAGRQGVVYAVPELATRVQHYESILKLLHSCVPSFTYSVKAMKRFYANSLERSQILADYRNAGDLYGWISYVMRALEQNKVDDPVGLCGQLATEICKAEVVLSQFSLSRHMGEFLYGVIKQSDDSVRSDMLDWLVRNEKALALSETVVYRLLRHHHIWKDGVFYSEVKDGEKVPEDKQLFAYKDLYDAAATWLDTVRKVAAGSGIVGKQHNVLSIFYRWSQFNNNDFSEVQSHVACHMENGEWVGSFLRLVAPDPNGHEIYPFIQDVPGFVALIRQQHEQDEHAQVMAEFLERMHETESKKADEVIEEAKEMS